MIILKFFWWAIFIGSAIASLGSFTNEKANSNGRFKNYVGISFLSVFVITYFLGTFLNYIPGILTLLFDLFYWILTFSFFSQVLWWYVFLGSFFVSMSLFLSNPDEYEGGELDLELYGPDAYPERSNTFRCLKGEALFFQSDYWHRVRPVKSGVRKSLVAWFFGPPFDTSTMDFAPQFK